MAAVLPLRAASCATSAIISTVTVPSDEGVISAVKVMLSAVCRFPAVPLPTVMSEAMNPVTASLNVTVIPIGETLVGSEAAEVMLTVGAVPS